jgi:urease accessory protein
MTTQTAVTARATLGLVAALFVNAALAHVESGAAAVGGLASGFLHPIGGLDHVLAMVAVGLWGAQLGAPALWLLPIAFPLVMALGGLLGLLGVALPGVETGIALSGIVLGAAVLLRWQPPLFIALACVAGFAIFHGYAHGAELPEGASALTYSLGFVVATGLLHAAGIALGLLTALPRGTQMVRALGGIVCLGGLYFLVGAG